MPKAEPFNLLIIYFVLPSKHQRHGEHWSGNTNCGSLELLRLILLDAQHQSKVHHLDHITERVSPDMLATLGSSIKKKD
jgi:hypothetical protein